MAIKISTSKGSKVSIKSDKKPDVKGSTAKAVFKAARENFIPSLTERDRLILGPKKSFKMDRARQRHNMRTAQKAAKHGMKSELQEFNMHKENHRTLRQALAETASALVAANSTNAIARSGTTYDAIAQNISGGLDKQVTHKDDDEKEKDSMPVAYSYGGRKDD